MIETLNLIDWIKDEENTLLEKKVAEGRAAAHQTIGTGLLNIRGRNRAEGTLRKEQEFNAIALKCIQDGIITCNPSGGSVGLIRAAQVMAAELSLIPLELLWRKTGCHRLPS